MNKQIKIGSIIAYINIALNLVVNFMLAPFMLKHLGESEYGVYKIVQSFTGQLAIMSFGLATVSARYVVVYNTQHKKKEKENFLFMIYGVSIVLSLLVTLIGFVLYLLMDKIYANSLSPDELIMAKRICLFLVLNVALSILCDSFTGIIKAYEKFVISHLLSTLRLVFRLSSIIILLSIGVKSIGIVLTDLSITACILMFSVLYVRLVLKEKAHFYSFEKKSVKEISTFAIAVFLQAIVNQVNQNLDNTILGIMTNTSVVTTYSIALTLYTCFISLVTVMGGMFGPKATKLVASGASGEELTEFAVAPGRIQLMIALLGIIGFVFCGKDFVFLWMGDGFDDVYPITLILIIPATLSLIESVTNTILDAMLKRMVRSIILVGMCVINIAVSIVLIKIFGYIGAAFGTAISVIIGHGVFINLYLHTKIGLDIPKMFRMIFKGILPAFLLCLALGYFVTFIPGRSMIGFGVKGGLITLIYSVVMFLVGMNEQEKQYIGHFFKRK